MLVHLLGMEISDEKADVVALIFERINKVRDISQRARQTGEDTGTGFLRRMTKFSARIIMKRVNL